MSGFAIGMRIPVWKLVERGRADRSGSSLGAPKETGMKHATLALALLAATGLAYGKEAAVHNDFNHDGVSDLLWYNATTTGPYHYILMFMTIDPEFIPRPTNFDSGPIGTGDFEGFGLESVLTWTPVLHDFTLCTYARTCRFIAIQHPGPSFQAVGTGDFDNDGITDVLWRNRLTGINRVSWSSQHFQTLSIASAGIDWQVVGIGDFNGDGAADVFWRNSVTGANSIWRSAQRTTRQIVTAVNLDWKVAGIGDFNGDGVSDVFWRKSSNGANVIWKSADYLSQQRVTAAKLEWRLASIGDFNGDGRSDVFWKSTSTGYNVIWYSASSTNPSISWDPLVSEQAWQPLM